MEENREYCKRIAEEIEAYAAGQITNDEGEEMSLYDWAADALDAEYIIDSRLVYKACRIWVTLGGPNVWVDTEEGAVKLAWGTDRASYPLTLATRDELDSIAAETWEAMGKWAK